MVFERASYRALVVSSSEKFSASLRELLAAAGCGQIRTVESAVHAKRMLLENRFDFVLINAPLPDEMGLKLAMDASSGKDTVCLLFVRGELYAEVREKVIGQGVFLQPKPTSVPAIRQSLDFLIAARARLKNLERKTVQIEEKMEEIRLVNRAKWLLISQLQMTEPDAHRYIEKQAMDRCVSKREIAAEIIGTYA